MAKQFNKEEKNETVLEKADNLIEEKTQDDIIKDVMKG